MSTPRRTPAAIAERKLARRFTHRGAELDQVPAELRMGGRDA